MFIIAFSVLRPFSNFTSTKTLLRPIATYASVGYASRLIRNPNLTKGRSTETVELMHTLNLWRNSVKLYI